MVERAKVKIDSILAEHKPEPLPVKTREKLREIVLRAKPGYVRAQLSFPR